MSSDPPAAVTTNSQKALFLEESLDKVPLSLGRNSRLDSDNELIPVETS